VSITTHTCIWTQMFLLCRWWLWKFRGWSRWLPTALCTARWRWRVERSYKLTRLKHPNQR